VIDPSVTQRQAPCDVPTRRVAEVLIDGVVMRRADVIGDDRGVIIEVLNTADPYWDAGVPYLYMGTCRPGKAKGWGIHDEHTDRYVVVSGEMLLVLYDDRDGSPTKGVVQESYLTREGYHQITIPAGVWHAHMNLGTDELVFLNGPTKPFRHASPDKRRLPLDNDFIPYTFRTGLGW
jgi:dTDP-4-dehydrorhamnose 3,5-epimerase